MNHCYLYHGFRYRGESEGDRLYLLVSSKKVVEVMLLLVVLVTRELALDTVFSYSPPTLTQVSLGLCHGIPGLLQV